MPALLRLLPAAAVAFAALAGSAHAATVRLVDDDKKQCKAAKYTRIQDAVDAAAKGDTVKVCAGTYRERVEVPYQLKGLKLLSQPRYAATIAAPPTFTGRAVPWSLVVLRADAMSMAGFNVTGPLPRLPDERCEDFPYEALLSTPAGSPTVQYNRFSNASMPACGVTRRLPAIYAGNYLDELGPTYGKGVALIDRNEIQGTGVVVDSFWAKVLRNRITGPGGFGVSFGDWAGGDVAGNDISGQQAAVRGGGPDAGKWSVRGNTIHDNEVGVFTYQFSDTVPLVERNTLDRNGYGLYGAGEAVFRNNVVRNSRVYDCYDAYAEDLDVTSSWATWTGNRGKTSNPKGLCRA